MLTGIRFPHKISATELDQYLESGWRPMGQGIYTTNFLRPEDGKIYGTFSTRLPLNGYSFRKSLQKLLKRNRKKFTVKARKAALSKDILKVAEAYNEVFPDKGGTDIRFYLENHRGERVFETWEIAVYDGQKMVAFSFYDIGATTLYSKIGLYDPEYGNYSLGIFTMLEEIQVGLDQGLSYYYPGYVAVGLPAFDYKHRIGQLEYYEIQTNQWRPYHLLDPCRTPLQQMKHSLEQVYDNLPPQLPVAGLFTYPQFDIKLSLPESLPYLDNPFILITTSPSRQEFSPFVTVFNPVQETYEILQVLLVGGQLVPSMIQNAQKWQNLTVPLICTQPLFHDKQWEKVVNYLGKL